MKKLIITHRDLDGVISAVGFVWNFFEGKKVSKKKFFETFKIIDYSYDEDINKKIEKIDLNKISSLIICDLAFSFDLMKAFYKKFKSNFIWIDHHKLAIENIEKNLKNIQGLRDYNYAACYLVWMYFKISKKNIPTIVKYTQETDLGRASKKINIKNYLANFDYVKQKMNKDKYYYFYEKLFEKNFLKDHKKLMSNGNKILKQKKKTIEQDIKNGKIVNFTGLNAFFIKSEIETSLVADIFFKKRNKLFKNLNILIVSYKKKKYCYSLRAKKNYKIDLSKIAKKFGGGGHPRAAAFCINHELDFNKN